MYEKSLISLVNSKLNKQSKKLPVDNFILVQILESEEDTGGVKDCPRLAKDLIVNVHHEVTTTGVLHHKANVLGRLKAGKEIDQKRVAHLGGRLKDALLREQTFHLVTSYNVALLQRLDGKVIFCFLELAEEDLVKKLKQLENVKYILHH